MEDYERNIARECISFCIFVTYQACLLLALSFHSIWNLEYPSDSSCPFFLFLENHKDSEKYLGVRLLSILKNWARKVCKKSIEIEIQSGLLLVWSLHVISVSI